jgi:glycosyltransferase involved in cell wall biosynthesis
MEINLNYVHSSTMGYGRYGVKLAEALKALGMRVYDHLPSHAHPDPEHDGAVTGIANTVCWVSVPTHADGWYQGQRTVLSTMWEATRLPESFRDTLHEFDQIIVPSRHNVELFGEYHPNVAYVPLGFDPRQWRYEKRPPLDAVFRFLIGGSGERKGTDLAYRAFRKVFKTWPADGPVPVLTMKNPRNEDFYGDRIEMVTGKMSDAAEVDLYRTAHVYLQPSRGEGFGLQPLQAIAQGIPTILTDAHGHEAFAHLGLGIPAGQSKSAYFIYGDAGTWWEPDFNELCERMEYVYNNYEFEEQMAARNATIARDTFTWAHTARNFIDAIGTEHLTVPFSGGGWYEPEARRYLVRVNKDFVCDISGLRYRFVVGQDYWEPSDVLRILFEAELLEPSCLTAQGVANPGLAPAQVAEIGAYSASQTHCPTCGQMLNSGPTWADLEMSR